MLAFTQEYLDVLVDTLKNDEKYQKVAKGYNSEFQITALPCPKMGVTETYGFGFYLPDFHDSWMGERDATIVLTAPYDVLHKIMMGKLNPVTAIMTRKSKIKGPMGKVLKYNGATNRFVKVLQSIPAEFHGDFEPLVIDK